MLIQLTQRFLSTLTTIRISIEQHIIFLVCIAAKRLIAFLIVNRQIIHSASYILILRSMEEFDILQRVIKDRAGILQLHKIVLGKPPGRDGLFHLERDVHLWIFLNELRADNDIRDVQIFFELSRMYFTLDVQPIHLLGNQLCNEHRVLRGNNIHPLKFAVSVELVYLVSNWSWAFMSLFRADEILLEYIPYPAAIWKQGIPYLVIF